MHTNTIPVVMTASRTEKFDDNGSFVELKLMFHEYEIITQRVTYYQDDDDLKQWVAEMLRKIVVEAK